jgi:hypothetical protein
MQYQRVNGSYVKNNVSSSVYVFTPICKKLSYKRRPRNALNGCNCREKKRSENHTSSRVVRELKSALSTFNVRK